MGAEKMKKYELIEIDLTKVLNANKESWIHGLRSVVKLKSSVRASDSEDHDLDLAVHRSL